MTISITKSSRIVALAVGACLVLAVAFGGFVAPAYALTQAEATTIIQVLGLTGSQAAAIQALVSGGSSTTSLCTFTGPLTIGATGPQVTCLQENLISLGFSIPAGATGYFGTQTRGAVAAWQASKNIVPPAGSFGPISQQAWATSGGGGTTGGGTTGGGTTGGSLSGGSGSVEQYTLVSGLNTEEVGEDTEDVEVAGLEIEADSGSDLEFTAVRLVFVQGTANHDFDKYASEVSVWLDGEEVGRADADKFNSDNTYTATISLDGAILRASETGELVAAVSGINNLDSADATDTWTVDFRQVRFVDADGASILEDPGTRTFSFEDFATATNAVLKLLEDDADINDARTIEVDATADTDGVDVLSFTLEAEGDSDLEIKNYAVSVTVTGAANTDDVLSSLTLWIDGEEIASATTVSSGGTTEDYLFADVDYTIPAGETVEAVIKADFLSIADALDEGDTIAFAINEDIDHITTSIKVVDEAGGDLLDGGQHHAHGERGHRHHLHGLSHQHDGCRQQRPLPVASEGNCVEHG